MTTENDSDISSALNTDGSYTAERRILSMMRKVLSAVARDTAPEPGMRHALTEDTIRDIRDCLYVISIREKELATLQGKSHSLTPGYIDKPRKSKMVSLEPANAKKNLKCDQLLIEV